MPFKDPEAQRAYSRKRYLENREAIKARVKAYSEANPDKAAERSRLWVENNRERSNEIKRKSAAKVPKERQAARQVEWRNANPDKVQESQRRCEDRRVRAPLTEQQIERRRELRRARRSANMEVELAKARAYRAANRDKYNASAQKRRARLRTPLWDAELTELAAREAYTLASARAALTGANWEVDHVVPLFGRCVSGFHTWSNLQVIPTSANRRKSNNFQPT